MEPERDTEGTEAIMKVTLQKLQINDSDSETCESDSESSDDEVKIEQRKQEKRKIEEEKENLRRREELLENKERKKKKKQKKREQNSQSCSQSLNSPSNQHSTPTEKSKFELGENGNATQNSIEEVGALRENELGEKRGLVVVCCHTEFELPSHTLSSRPSAAADLDMMGVAWENYSCEVMTFNNEGNEFYHTDLVEKIKVKLRMMECLEFFVFVLSTHGEEKDDRKKGGDASFQHYFYTNDGQMQTQTLINGIAKIVRLKDKIKAFFIQACRSRANPSSESKNIDQGFEIKVIKKVSSMEELKPQNKSGITVEDAKGYMPSDDKDISEMKPAELVDPVEPVALFPHCDDSIVMFSSMSGKFAYSLKHSPDEGGWLIKSLNDELRSYKSGNEIFILDALTEVNRKVSKREAENNKNYPDLDNIEQLKAQSCFLHNITEEFCLKHE